MHPITQAFKDRYSLRCWKHSEREDLNALELRYTRYPYQTEYFSLDDFEYYFEGDNIVIERR